MNFTLSPRTLGMYDRCDRCFYEIVKEKDKRVGSIFPSLPSGMDKVLKIYFERYAKKGQVPPEVHPLGDFKPFHDPQQLKVWMNNRRGIRVSTPEGHTLMGAVDCILEKENTLLVLDYKTRGFPLKDNTASYYQTQMDTYNFLLQENGHQTSDISALLFYYPKSVRADGSVKFNRELVTLHVNIQNPKDLFYGALDCLESAKPDPNEDCRHCTYWPKV